MPMMKGLLNIKENTYSYIYENHNTISISPSCLVVLITSKRGKLISAGTLATVVASYVVLIS